MQRLAVVVRPWCVVVIERRGSDPDEWDFDQFFRSRFERSARLAYLLCGSTMHAQEIAQEALLAVHRRWGELDEPDGYLRRAIVNLSRSVQRRAVLERRHAWRFESREGPAHTAAAADLWEELGQLRHDQRAVVVLRFYEDRSIDEIAAILGKPAGTVKSLLHRGLRALKEAIDDQS